MDFTHNRRKTHHRPLPKRLRAGGRGRAPPAKSSALTLLWSYCRNTACSQLLELAAILPWRGGAGRRVDVAIRPGSNRHDVDIALTTARAEACPCGGARRGRRRSRRLFGWQHGRRSPAKRGRRLARRHATTPGEFETLSGGQRHAAPTCDHGAHRRRDEKARKRTGRGAQPCCGSRRQARWRRRPAVIKGARRPVRAASARRPMEPG
jgi:hypothetical protein